MTGLISTLAIAWLFVSGVGLAQAEEAPAQGGYRIGAILVDEAARRFSVTGRIVHHEAPLESIAVSKGGTRSGKGLIEIDSNAIEFNLACLLIGLDPRHADVADDHAAHRPTLGDAVAVTVSWTDGRGHHTVMPVADLLDRKRSVSAQGPWVYTGSILTQDSLYMADVDGTVIGFVHDPSSIIEHRLGLGLDDSAVIGADPDRVPPVGTRIELEIRNLTAGAGHASGTDGASAPGSRDVTPSLPQHSFHHHP